LHIDVLVRKIIEAIHIFKEGLEEIV